MSIDRRDIAPFLRPYFPSMQPNATSDDWHGFLNAQTKLDVSLDELNSSAFDKWRQALGEQGFPVWGIDAKHEADIALRGSQLLALEVARIAKAPALLESLAIEAPMVTAAQLLETPKP